VKHEFHADNKRMIHLVQDSLLQMQVLNRVVLNHDILPYTLHCIELLGVLILYQVYLNKNSEMG
jgi:hypothetical protein